MFGVLCSLYVKEAKNRSVWADMYRELSTGDVVQVCDVWRHEEVCIPLWAVAGAPPKKQSKWGPVATLTAAGTDASAVLGNVGGSSGVEARADGRATGAPFDCCRHQISSIHAKPYHFVSFIVSSA